MQVVILPNDYVKYELVYIGQGRFLSGLPQRNISIKRAIKNNEYTLLDVLISGLYLLRELHNGD